MSTIVLPVQPQVQNQVSEKTEWRNYDALDEKDHVAQFYLANHKNQTFDFVKAQKEKFLKFNTMKMTMMDAIRICNEIVDESDPDTELPQIVHLLQTAEAIRKEYPGEEYDWLHLVGFLHDAGKVLCSPKFGKQPQWAVVGDTFPVGCEFAKQIIYHPYFKHNPDTSNPEYSTKLGIYKEGCGLDNVHFSWGHDEYIYQVAVHNKTTIPLPGLYILRYHSFYAWHTHGGYTHLMNDTDREMLPWVKKFQKFDLYSKLPKKPNPDELLPYYEGLIKKYFPTEQLEF